MSVSLRGSCVPFWENYPPLLSGSSATWHCCQCAVGHTFSVLVSLGPTGHKASGNNPTIDPLFCAGGWPSILWGVEISQNIWGIIWVLGVFFSRSWKKDRWFSPLKRPWKTLSLWQKRYIDSWRAANYLLFLNMWIFACVFFACFHNSWMPCWNPQDGL